MGIPIILPNLCFNKTRYSLVRLLLATKRFYGNWKWNLKGSEGKGYARWMPEFMWPFAVSRLFCTFGVCDNERNKKCQHVASICANILGILVPVRLQFECSHRILEKWHKCRANEFFDIVCGILGTFECVLERATWTRSEIVKKWCKWWKWSNIMQNKQNCRIPEMRISH